MEIKQLGVDSLQLKFVGDDMSFSGYASVFGGVDALTGRQTLHGSGDITIDLHDRVLRNAGLGIGINDERHGSSPFQS